MSAASNSGDQSSDVAMLQRKIEAALDGDVQHIAIVDESGGGCDGGKFSAVIVSNKFDGVPLIDRHHMINRALADELKRIHAFTMKTWTPAQWEKKKAETS